MFKAYGKVFKWVICVLVFSVMFLVIPKSTNAITVDSLVRVGLESKYLQKDVVEIDNNTISLGYSNMGYFQPQAAVTGGDLRVSANTSDYLRVEENLITYEQAVLTANSYKTMYSNVIISLISPGNFGVYIRGGNKEEVASMSAQTGFPIVANNGKSIVLSDGNTPILLFENSTFPVEIAGNNGEYIKLGNETFRGSMDFHRSGNTITPVNVLTIDEYLYSVVPSEMPAEWPLEALKAQAVAARNYTMTRAGIHKDQGYDLCDNTHCQMYLGVNNESITSTKAVDETSGIMAYYNSEIISATYFSSSGGYTNDSQDVWQNQFNYLVSVPDTYETTYKNWTRTFTMAELTNILKTKGYDIGNVIGVSTKLDEKSQRVLELTFVGTDGQKSVYKDEIRTVFNQTEGGSLQSNNFVVQSGNASIIDTKIYVQGQNGKEQRGLTNMYGTDSNGKSIKTDKITAIGGNNANAHYDITTTTSVSGADAVTFVGKGWGHGVGMSQYGAKGMAEAGHSYDEILKHYYTGVEVR